MGKNKHNIIITTVYWDGKIVVEGRIMTVENPSYKKGKMIKWIPKALPSKLSGKLLSKSLTPTRWKRLMLVIKVEVPSHEREKTWTVYIWLS